MTDAIGVGEILNIYFKHIGKGKCLFETAKVVLL